MNQENKSLAPPFGALYLIIQTILVTLKLTGDLPWSWWLVPLPTYIYFGISFLTVIWMGLWIHWIMKHADEEAIEECKKNGAFKRFVQDLGGADEEDEDEQE